MRPHIRLSMAVKLPYMSERTFSKYLRSATGLTFSAMVKKLRIALRKRLFDTTTASIAQVAELSGYRTMANFYRQFLAEVGRPRRPTATSSRSRSRLPRGPASGSRRASAPDPRLTPAYPVGLWGDRPQAAVRLQEAVETRRVGIDAG